MNGIAWLQANIHAKVVQLFSLVAVHNDDSLYCCPAFSCVRPVRLWWFDLYLCLLNYFAGSLQLLWPTRREAGRFAMPVPFDFSVGDFIAGIKLLKNAVDSLSDARGATVDYAELRKTLVSLDKALDAANQLTAPEHRAAVDAEVAGCKSCVKMFLSDFAKFELLRTGFANTSKLTFAFRKLQWSLCKKEDVQRFKEHLQTHTTALQLQLAVLSL
jgi:hypothetical protein